jgi:hypothetical protein
MDVPARKSWKQDLATYLRPDWVAIALGVVATLFLVRMYSLFHDLAHNSMRRSDQQHEERTSVDAMFRRTPVVTVRSGLTALRLKLWGEERGCLVPYVRG